MLAMPKQWYKSDGKDKGARVQALVVGDVQHAPGLVVVEAKRDQALLFLLNGRCSPQFGAGLIEPTTTAKKSADSQLNGNF